MQRAFLGFAFSLISLTLSACGGGGSEGSAPTVLPPSPPTPPPGTPTGLSITSGTSFQFTWNAVPGATAYRLREDPTGTGTFSQIGGDIPTSSYFHNVALWQRVNARYIIQACNASGCTDSTPLVVSGLITTAIGYAKASNSGAGDFFGVAVSLSNDGNTMAIGAIGENSLAPNSGAAYVFTRSSGIWSQQALLKASNPGTGDNFGVSITLSGDGNTLAVGAYQEDSNATGINGNQANNSAPGSGAAYVFIRDNAGQWTQQAYLKSSNSEAGVVFDSADVADTGDVFGVSVALSNDGDTLAVGAYREDSNATGINGDQTNNGAPNAGAVYVFTRSAATWSQQAYIKASNPDAGDRFGSWISMSGNGTTLAIGARFEDGNGIGGEASNTITDSGAVYVFTRSGVVWAQQAYLKASSPGANDLFGAMVTLSNDGNTLAVGARQEDSASTGVDGNQIDESAPDSGAVYVFTRNAGIWNQQAYIKASNTDSGDWFGVRVALSHDGNMLAVGSQYEGSSATGLDGNEADNSASGSGAAYLFTRTAGIWTQTTYLKSPNTGTGDLFGSWVAMSADGNVLAIGAQEEDSNSVGVGGDQTNNNAIDAGAVYLY
ncbi:MAG: integrin [Nitrospira sp.]|nr:integrin [Nitrospira sp.]